MTKMTKNDKVVYLHKKKSNGEVFYVGAGSIKRPYVFGWKRSKMWQEVFDNNEIEVEVINSELSEEDAYHIEIELIAAFGRIGIEEGGQLVNRSTGGANPAQGTVLTDETKRKMKLAHAHPMEFNGIMYESKHEAQNAKREFKRLKAIVTIDGIEYVSVTEASKQLGLHYRKIVKLIDGYVKKEMSDEQRDALSKARQGVKLSEETKKNISIAAKNRFANMSEEEKQTILDALNSPKVKELNRIKKPCPHCGIEAVPASLGRNHGIGKCKM